MTSGETPQDDGRAGSGGPERTTTSDGAFDIADLPTLWVRWTDVRPGQVRSSVDDIPIPLVDVHLHRYCDLFPSRTTEQDLDVGFRFVGGLPRTLLRYTPLAVLVTSVLLVVYAEFSARIVGISELFPNVPGVALVALSGGVVVWIGIVYLVGRVGLIDTTELLKALVVWGLIVTLLLGSLYSVYLVLSVSDPTRLGPHIVFVSGYLLMVLLGGVGVYDGILRTETLFGRLHEGKTSIVSNRVDSGPDGDDTAMAVYVQWLDDLRASLHDDIYGIPTSHLFAFLFVIQFAAIWSRTGPQYLDSAPLLWINVVADFVLVVVAFRFLVLVKYIYLLMTDQYAPDDDTETRILTYQPFHYDRRGGFQDFGRFAMRVNLLLLVGGLYTIYRLYVQGLRSLPLGGGLHFEAYVQLFMWIGNFIVPVAMYAIASAAWVYYSFWAIHRKMVMDKRLLSAKYQGVRGGNDPLPTVGDSVADFEDGIDWYYLHTAPEWPINSRYITSLVSANAVPLLLPLLRFLR